MKILAVIPARAGSKGIPNKNIRIVNGKPLIAYCIENALCSKYITDIVITTDSEEIELIAKYYKVPYLHRCSELCKDNVTLDAVIYDVCKNFEGEYVITMQPTSPTLKADTLDEAIEYAIEKDTDTLISVVNRPHLAWIERAGKIIPDYSERLNRQYLPKRFLETGAFVISKSKIVTEKTRIGKKVDVFEISDNEAIDIDSFQDLLCAEQVLKQCKIAIIVNGNHVIGMGHISRMLELADQFYVKPDFFYDEQITAPSNFGKTTYRHTGYKSTDELFDMLEKEQYKIVINDILDTSVDYMSRLKGIVPYVVNFEDSGEGGNSADMVINALYSEKDSENRKYCGADYYFMPKLFLMYKPIKINDVVKNIFICFGGADPQNYTEKILDFISEKKYYGYHFTVVLGKAKANFERLIKQNSQQNIEIMYDVKNMPELMSKCDVAITSQGRTCYELASLGIPTLAIAQNEREERHSFVCENNGFVNLPFGCDIIDIKEKAEKLISFDKNVRKRMQKRMLQHDLKTGRERVRALIDSL